MTSEPATESRPQDLETRLQLIESMIAEGRQTTSRWGWVFVLWGVAYYVAILGTSVIHFAYAWPATMLAAGILTSVLAARKTRGQPSTTMGRAISSIWIAMAVSMFVLFPALGISGRIDQYILISVASAMLGMAYAASAILLRWKVQFVCAVVWWANAAFACFGRSAQVTAAFLTAIFICLFAFGIYGMIADRQVHRREARHA
ncbi:MAG: hypothetical protein P4L40_06990 [Terracidiphilus sp.]|nr:hypothetical protein [Terracidiphilus sp.]